MDFDYLMPLNAKVDKFAEFTSAAKLVKEITSLIRRSFHQKIPPDLAKIIALNQQMSAGKMTDRQTLLFVEAILAKQWLHQSAIKNAQIKRFTAATLALIENQTKFGYDKHVENFQSTFLTCPPELGGAKELQPKMKELFTEVNALYTKFLKTNNNNLKNLICFHAQMQQ